MAVKAEMLIDERLDREAAALAAMKPAAKPQDRTWNARGRSGHCSEYDKKEFLSIFF
jgi:hypothetical protein